jgi:hypothetical protein
MSKGTGSSQELLMIGGGSDVTGSRDITVPRDSLALGRDMMEELGICFVYFTFFLRVMSCY